MATGAQTWSTTAALNNSVDSSVNWAEGQAPSSVNNSARAEMASVAMWIGDNSGTLLTSGSTTAYTVTSKQVSTAVVDGYTIAVRFHAANDASATLNVDGVAAKAIELYAGQGLVGGEFQAGSVARFTYTSSSTSWVLNNFPRLVGTVTSPVGFQITSTSTSVPGYSFSGDTNTGFYRIGADNVGILCGGTKAVDISTSASVFLGTLTSSGALAGSLISTGTVEGSAATQAQQETGTTLGAIVTPGRQHFHPGHPKGWTYVGVIGGAGVVTYNVTSHTDNGTGDVTINWATDFSSANHCDVATTIKSGVLSRVRVEAIAAGTTQLLADNNSAAADPDGYFCCTFGDHA